MLVISRKQGESLLIGDNIKISILSLGGDKVGIGIDAPKDIPILRAELIDIIEANKEAVANKTETRKYEDIAKLIKGKKL